VRTPGALRARVERIARAAGADAVRIASAESDAATRARLGAAFGRGDFATWGYDDAYAAAASAPGALLPGARSVVCIAVGYATPRPSGRRTLHGRVSNYAWSADYHRPLRAMLERIAAELEMLEPGARSVVACDTAPLAERAFAARAGLGWTGKHTNLIVPELGSFAFLGEVVTTLALPVDAPLKKSCGSCSRCVDVCPTGALRGDYTIDAGRCISDLTQRTDAVPLALRPLLGDWVWGCDLCQDVCPPTVRAALASRPAFEPLDPGAAEPDLIALLELRSGTYKRRFRRTAMGWRGAAVLRRNAALALGNALDRSAVPALERALAADPHPLVRGHAAWALGRIGSPRALAALARRSSVESDDTVLAEIAAARQAWETAGPGDASEARRIDNR
jgi:epoxyqueuosine reductase